MCGGSVAQSDQMRVQVGHGCQQDVVVVLGRWQQGLRVCRLRLSLCHAGQVLYDVRLSVLGVISVKL